MSYTKQKVSVCKHRREIVLMKMCSSAGFELACHAVDEPILDPAFITVWPQRANRTLLALTSLLVELYIDKRNTFFFLTMLFIR